MQGAGGAQTKGPLLSVMKSGWVPEGAPRVTPLSLLLTPKSSRFFLGNGFCSCFLTSQSHSSALILAFSVICLNCYISFLSRFSSSIFLSTQGFLCTVSDCCKYSLIDLHYLWNEICILRVASMSLSKSIALPIFLSSPILSCVLLVKPNNSACC